MAPLYPAPLKVALNTEEGYIINPVTGDSIQPLINSLGDTVTTGVPVVAIGKAIHPDSVAKPIRIPAEVPEVVHPSQNVIKVPEALRVIPVDRNSLRTFTPGIDTASFVLLNSTGDTIPTGVPLPFTGEGLSWTEPQPIKALPPHMKDNASINLKYLNVDQGMISSYVFSILEDSQGHLWFGTAGGGISMYNGETFTHFTEKEGVSPYLVYSTLEDSHGNFWFGSYLGGVNRYDGESFTHYSDRDGLSNNTVLCLLEDSFGNIWLGTEGGGVSMFNGETIIHLTEKEGLSNNVVWSIHEDHNGHLWFGTEGGGVCMYNGKTFTHFTEKDGLSSNIIWSILEDSQDRLWFGTGGGGVNMYNGKTITHFSEREGLSNNYVRAILEDSHNNLWFGTNGGGANKYNGESFRYFTEEEGLSNNNIRSIIEDSHGNLWFATEGGGVSMYNDGTFSHFTEKDGLSDDRIRSILEDSQGNLWFGTGGGGVSRYNGDTFTNFIKDKGLSDAYISSILEDSQGRFWFGTWGDGMSMYDGEFLTHFTYKEGFSRGNVWSILEDSQGNLWFATWGGGISMYNGRSFTQFSEKEGLSNNYVSSIFEDSQGKLWFGTWGGGLSMYDGENFTHLTQKEGLYSNEVLCIQEDSHGNLWFGTGPGGVSMYDGEFFTHFTEKEGLCNDIVYSIIEDRSSNIWLTTEKGINCLVPDPDSINVSYNNPAVHTYGIQDGLKGLDFFPGCGLLDRNNRIWWGSSQSLTMLDMNNFKIAAKAPAMQLNRIEINEQFLDYRHLEKSTNAKMKFDSVVRFYNYPLNLELPYNLNHLTFHFSALDWAAPHKIKYTYKMEGLSDHWSNPTSQAIADYRSLPYGTYTFKVSAIGEAQKWSDPFEYTFSITPPWWHTWWARTGFGITVLLVIFGFVRQRTARLKKRQKELEAEVDSAILKIREQKEEVEAQRDEIEDQKQEIEAQRDEVVVTNEALEKQKIELELALENLKLAQSQLIQSEKMASVGILTAGIAHELNNPINFVSGNVKPLWRDVTDIFTIIRKYEEIVKSKKLENVFGEVDALKATIDFSIIIKEIMNLLEGIEEGAKRSSQIVKGLRIFSRLDDDICQLYNIHEVIDSTLLLLQNQIKNRITVRKDYGDLEEIECFPSKLNQVIMNILTNSIQAIEDNGEIFIQTLNYENGVRIYIKDNGKGMTPEVQKHIFDPFYTTKDVGKGTGLGLSISYGIIEQHHGNIEVISAPGKGAEFIISLPGTLPNQNE